MRGWPAPYQSAKVHDDSHLSVEGGDVAIKARSRDGMEQVLRIVRGIKVHLATLQADKHTEIFWTIFFDRVDLVCLVIFEAANVLLAIALNMH